MFLYLCPLIATLTLGGFWGLYKYQDKLIFDPEYLPTDYQYNFNGPYEEINIKTKDALINALHFKTTNPKGVILYIHGNSGSLNTWGELGEEYIKTGYDFFIFDYRGYGKSKGTFSESGIHNDLKLIYEHLKGIYSEDRIIIYGRSLGTGFATKLASETNPKSLILETPYFSFQSVAQTHYPYLPVSIVLRYSIRTDIWLPKVNCPILIFHGTDDETIPYENSVQLKPLLKKADKYITIEHATHNNIPLFPEYLEQLTTFIN